MKKIKQWVAGLDVGHSKIFIFFVKNFVGNYEKKKILGT